MPLGDKRNCHEQQGKLTFFPIHLARTEIKQNNSFASSILMEAEGEAGFPEIIWSDQH
jgi:hypothetical protein